MRRAAPADLARITEIEEEAFGDPWPGDLIASEMANPGSLVLVALPTSNEPPALAPAPCAYACFRHGGGEAELLRVAVVPAARGQGLAATLITAGLDHLRANGVVSCHLEVRLENAPALAVYHQLGFAPVGRRRAYYRDGSDALVLRRDL